MGLRVASAAYSGVKEGNVQVFEHLSLNVLNYASDGELNHGRKFYTDKKKIVLCIPKYVIFLSNRNPVTNHLPFLSVTTDKSQHCTEHMK